MVLRKGVIASNFKFKGSSGCFAEISLFKGKSGITSDGSTEDMIVIAVRAVRSGRMWNIF